MDIISILEKEQMRSDIPQIRIGDFVKVYVKIIEGQKERVQLFEGLVIRKKNSNCRLTFTVRKISYGIGVERIFPIHSPIIEKIIVISNGHTRRAKLYYIRKIKGKEAKIKGLS